MIYKTKKGVFMEYLGSRISRKIDYKRRFLLPSEWIDDTTEFFFVQQDDGLLLYPKETWKKIIQSKETFKEKGDLAKKSIYAKLNGGRLILPKQYAWKRICLIGIIDCVIINESAVGADFFYAFDRQLVM